MTRANLSPAEAAALEELEHNCDLICARPLPCEVEWALSRVRQQAPERRAGQ